MVRCAASSADKIQGRIIFPMAGQPNKYFPPTLALLIGAVMWGTIWYPYRLLSGQNLQGTSATFLTYLITLLINAIFFWKTWRELLASPWLFFALAMGSGWANYAYVMGALEGEVMRVLLLFYLAPVWTVPLARWLLNERPTPVSYAVVALALFGAVTMLWRPQLGWPVPRSIADWYGLSAGFGFALNNVLARRLGASSIGAKIFASCFGVLLIELIVGAIASRWLAGESMSAQEWIGGILIVTATLISALPERQRTSH